MALGTTIVAAPGLWQTYNDDAEVISANGGAGLLLIANGVHSTSHHYVDCPDWTDTHILELREQRTSPTTTGAGAKVYVFGFNQDKSESWLCPAVADLADEDHTFGVSLYSHDATHGNSEVFQVNTDGAASVLVVVSIGSVPLAGTALLQGRFIRQQRT